MNYFYSKVVKKEKGPAPPPPTLPNLVVSTGLKESDDERLVSEANSNDNDNKPNQKEMIDSPKRKSPDENTTSSHPGVFHRLINFIKYSNCSLALFCFCPSDSAN